MVSQRTGLYVASAVFALFCLAQLARLIVRPEILVAGHILPLWPSVLAVLLAGGLAAWLWWIASGGGMGSGRTL
jgi:hypothetical protein